MSWIITYPPEYYLQLGGARDPIKLNWQTEQGVIICSAIVTCGDVVIC